MICGSNGVGCFGLHFLGILGVNLGECLEFRVEFHRCFTHAWGLGRASSALWNFVVGSFSVW